jgi:hypothetical protein
VLAHLLEVHPACLSKTVMINQLLEVHPAYLSKTVMINQLLHHHILAPCGIQPFLKAVPSTLTQFINQLHLHHSPAS